VIPRLKYRLALSALVILLIPALAPAQTQTESVPRVRMIIDDYDYMISLFPDDYASRREAIKACSTIAPEAESLKVFWDELGEYVLSYMSHYAGIDWVEPQFDIYIVKYYPDYACCRPMTIPLAGKKNGNRITAVGHGLSQYITLFQQLARRMLEQALLPGGSSYYIAHHPLMRKTPRRFDVLADLLALQTLADFKNIDSVMTVYKSAEWRRREPGQPILLDYFWGKWVLSGDSTLASLIAAEPYSSNLVALTRPPVVRKTQIVGWGNHQQQAPTGGRLGMSVARDRSGFFRVVRIDTLKLAYLSGLRKDDLIRNIDGVAPRTIKELFTLMLDNLKKGAHVNIIRNDEPSAVIVYPLEGFYTEPSDSE
jgi:hypothetical protein